MIVVIVIIVLQFLFHYGTRKRTCPRIVRSIHVSHRHNDARNTTTTHLCHRHCYYRSLLSSFLRSGFYWIVEPEPFCKHDVYPAFIIHTTRIQSNSDWNSSLTPFFWRDRQDHILSFSFLVLEEILLLYYCTDQTNTCNDFVLPLSSHPPLLSSSSGILVSSDAAALVVLVPVSIGVTVNLESSVRCCMPYSDFGTIKLHRNKIAI